MDDTLAFLRVWREEGSHGVGGQGWAGVDGGLCGFAWYGRVREEDAIFARKLLECYGDEGANAAYNEYLGVLVVLGPGR